MKISIITLFPGMFTGPFSESIIKHARAKNLVDITFVNLRDFGLGRHKTVDDTPYGGGSGMILKVDVVAAAIEKTRDKRLKREQEKVVLLSASGKKFEQKTAKTYANLSHLILICGHYEGVDERISQFVDEEISIGDFVVTGGEIPAMLVTDAVIRLIPGVLKEGVTDNESFHPLLEYPQYTKPPIFTNQKVPDLLLTGNHKKIEEWRKEKALAKTKKIRPDLLKSKE